MNRSSLFIDTNVDHEINKSIHLDVFMHSEQPKVLEASKNNLNKFTAAIVTNRMLIRNHCSCVIINPKKRNSLKSRDLLCVAENDFHII